jgi:protein dithiol:quinone oxidoreductase
MSRAFSRNQLLVIVAAVSFGAVGAALVSQHRFDMQPCPWCVLQRLLFVAIGTVALAGLAWRAWGGKRLVPFALLLLCGCGIAASLWQHFVASATASCNRTLADRIVSGLQLDALLPWVFEARANCADAAVDLLGVPYEFWSLALFVAIEAVALMLLMGGRRAAA